MSGGGTPKGWSGSLVHNDGSRGYREKIQPITNADLQFVLFNFTVLII